MSLRNDFTDLEWNKLEKTPVWAFILTSASDGQVDSKEMEAFAKELSETLLYNDQLAREVFLSAIPHIDTLLTSCLQDPAEMVAGLQSAGQIVDARCPQHAKGFKESVLLICKKVAEASGGGKFKRGGKVSEEEAAAIVVVAAALGVRM
jgi:hypothetical protein